MEGRRRPSGSFQGPFGDAAGSGRRLLGQFSEDEDDEELRVGERVQILFNGEWVWSKVAQAVPAGWKIRFDDDSVAVVPYAQASARIRNTVQAAAVEEEKVRRAADADAAAEAMRHGALAKLRPRGSPPAGGGESSGVADEPDEGWTSHFPVGTRVLLKQPDSSWAPGMVNRVLECTEYKSWRAFGVPSGKHGALEIVAYDDQGHKGILSFTGSNCDPIPFPLLKDFRYLRKDQSAPAGGGGENDFSPGASVDGSWRNFRRVKHLRSGYLDEADLKDVTMTIETDSTGAPDVTVKWRFSRGAGGLSSVSFSKSRPSRSIGSETSPENDLCARCTLMVAQAYLFLRLLAAFYTNKLPQRWQSEWTVNEVSLCAQGAKSATENTWLRKSTDLDLWEVLRIGPGDRHPLVLALNIAGRTGNSNRHFDFLEDGYIPPAALSSTPSLPLLAAPSEPQADDSESHFPRALRSIMGGANISVSPDIDLSVLHSLESFLQGGRGHPSLHALMMAIPRKAHAQKIFDEVGIPGEARGAAVILAYLCAMMSALELNRLAQRRAGSAPEVASMLLSPASFDSRAALAAQVPPMVRVYMCTLASVRCRSDEHNGVYRLLGAPSGGCDRRARVILTCFGSIISANATKGLLACLSCVQTFVAVLLLLDGRGASDKVLLDLQDMGVCDGPNDARAAVKEAAVGLSLETVFPVLQPEELGADAHVPALGFAGDNADVSVFQHVYNFIAVSAHYLGFTLAESSVRLVTGGLRFGADALPRPSPDKVEAHRLGAEDIEVLTHENRIYQIEALMSAYHEFLLSPEPPMPSLASATAAANASAPINVGADVDFAHLGRTVRGTVTEVDLHSCSVSFKYANGDIAVVTLPLPAVTLPKLPQPTPAPAPAATKLPEPGRHRYQPACSWVMDVLGNCSSKHFVAGAQVVACVVAATAGVYVPLIGVDFEFFKAVAMLFFVSGSAIIPMIAFGHLLKSVTTSKLSFYELLFVRPFLEADGIFPGTPAYNRTMKGRHISVTVCTLVRMFQNLHRSLALQFLRERGGMPFGAAGLTLREELLLAYSEKPDTETLIGGDGRPRLAFISRRACAIAAYFEEWGYAKANCGNAAAATPATSRGVFAPDIPTQLLWITRLKMNTAAEIPGARAHCAQRGILLPPHCTKSLALQKLYAFESAGGSEAGLLAAAAVTADDTDALPRPPPEANLNLKALIDFLWKAMPPYMLLLKLTRCRPEGLGISAVKDRMGLKGCPRCSGKFGTCRCTSRHPWLVALKGLLVSVFMRRQPNYQIALIIFLAFVGCAILHPVDLFVRVVLTMCEACLSLNKFGDSWNGEPLDLKQENDVGLAKEQAKRQPRALEMVVSRSKVSSFIKMLQGVRIFKRLASLAPAWRSSSASQRQEQSRREEVGHGVAHAVVQGILKAGSTSLVAGSSLEICHPQRVCHAYELAKDQSVKATAAVLQGLAARVAVALPPAVHPVSGTFHLQVVVRNREHAAADAKVERALLEERVRSMAARGELILPDQTSMLEGAKCGNNKSELGVALLERYGNHPGIPGADRPPVLLFRSAVEKAQYFAIEARNMIRCVDALMFLQKQPPPREKEAPNNLEELARSILVQMTRQFAEGAIILVLAFDTEDYITHLRVIQRQQRGKIGHSPEVQQALLGRRKQSERLEDLGGFDNLMRSKAGGLQRVIAEIAYQMKTPTPTWDPTALLPEGSALVLVGGFSGCVQTVVHGNGVLLGAGARGATVVSSTELGNALKGIEKQGEGEAIVYACLRRILVLTVESGGGVAPASTLAYDIVSYDTDAITRAMPELQRFFQKCLELGVPITLIRTFLTLHPKSTALVSSLGVAFQRRNGTELRSRVDGRFILATFDLTALHNAIACDPAAVGGGTTPSAKVVAATTAILALATNDMLPQLAGVPIRRVLEAFYSPAFHRAVAEEGPLVEELTTEGGALSTFELRPRAAVALMHIVMMQRPRTFRQLGLVHDKGNLDGTETLPSYASVEACAFVSGDLPPAPPLSSWLCRVSCSRVVFNQHANWLVHENPRPATSDAETFGSSFVRDVSGKIVARHRVLPGASKNKEKALEVLRSQFGARIVGDTSTTTLFPSSFQETLLRAFSMNGANPRAVPASLAFANGVVRSEGELMKFEEASGEYSEMTWNIEATVIQNSLLQHTQFKPKGQGRPQLLTATVAAARTNNGAWEAAEVSVAAIALDARLGDLLSVMRKGPSDEATVARGVLRRLLREVLMRACRDAEPAFIDQEAAEDEADDEDDRSDDESTDERGSDDEESACEEDEAGASGSDAATDDDEDVMGL